MPVPLLGAVVATRALLAFGAGLLVAQALRPRARRTLGWSLVAFGAASTVPLAARVLPLARRRAAPRALEVDVGA
jgi:hypothetical protein